MTIIRKLISKSITLSHWIVFYGWIECAVLLMGYEGQDRRSERYGGVTSIPVQEGIM